MKREESGPEAAVAAVARRRRVMTSKFRRMSARRSAGRWRATLDRNRKHTGVCTFDSEEEAARAWDRMMVWCDLHGVVLKRPGWGYVLDSSGIKASINFAYDECEGDIDGLRVIMTQEAMVQKLLEVGRAQPGCKRKRANGGAVALPAGPGSGDGDGGGGRGGSGGRGRGRGREHGRGRSWARERGRDREGLGTETVTGDENGGRR
jgi:hypothetical protein